MSNTLIVKGDFNRIEIYGDKYLITLNTQYNNTGMVTSRVQVFCTSQDWKDTLSSVYDKHISIEVRPTQSYSEFVSLVEWQENKPKGWQQLDMFSNAIAEGGQNESKL